MCMCVNGAVTLGVGCSLQARWGQGQRAQRTHALDAHNTACMSMPQAQAGTQWRAVLLATRRANQRAQAHARTVPTTLPV